MMYGTSSMLTMNPARSLATTTVFPSCDSAKAPRSLHSGVARQHAPHHLDQRHHDGRVEEVETDDTFGAARRRCNPRDRNGRRVGGEDGVRRLDNLVELAKQLLLELLVLDYGFDDKISVGHCVKVCSERQAAKGSSLVILRELAALNRLRKRLLDPRLATPRQRPG